MTPKQTIDEIHRIFRELETLLKEGQFKSVDIDFMEKFLRISLEATRKVKKRIEESNEQENQD